ncbi:hypothetical protein [Alkaliphilus sp. B6464]|uniref:hypothetical protein n=1 Tax=Alkaliphilus sp. B6464 TaxID=2731219 RepID=UPI001BA93936|nr:hypothetical protein [Alkaliphilus sp. B6464]QUH20253.1 hypothetical protein HYG84_10265 [Alkaliphilus sp. B6464]
MSSLTNFNISVGSLAITAGLILLGLYYSWSKIKGKTVSLIALFLSVAFIFYGLAVIWNA